MRAATSVLVLTWFHPLMDARGGQNLVAHLSPCRSTRGRDPLGRRVSGRRARSGPPDAEGARSYCRGQPEISADARSRAAGLPGDDAGPAGPSLLRAASFAGPDAGDQRATREISWRLAVVGKAMAELWQRRGLPDAPFLLPISVDLRPKGIRERRSGTSSRFTSRGSRHPTPATCPHWLVLCAVKWPMRSATVRSKPMPWPWSSSVPPALDDAARVAVDGRR